MSGDAGALQAELDRLRKEIKEKDEEIRRLEAEVKRLQAALANAGQGVRAQSNRVRSSEDCHQ